MICPKCGINLNQNAHSCESCGFNFDTKKSYRMSPAFAFILVIVAVGIIFSYISENGVNAGQEWCMNTISDYEENSSNINFNVTINENVKTKTMNPDDQPFNTPTFILSNDGTYRCMVPGGGIMFPSMYVYDSENKTWEYSE